MTNKKDICRPNCNFDTFMDECDNEIHFQIPKWGFAHLIYVSHCMDQTEDTFKDQTEDTFEDQIN
jgi:hypothetical protein